MFGGNSSAPDMAELAQLSGVFDLLPLLPPGAIAWMLEDGRYRRLRARGLLRQLSVFSATSDALQRAVRRRVSTPP